MDAPTPPDDSVATIGCVRNGLPLPPCRRTHNAAVMLIAASEFNPSYTASDAMRAVSFSEEQCKNPVFQRRVHRQKKKILEEKIPSSVLVATGGTTPTSSVSPLTASTPGKENSTSSDSRTGVKRRFSIEEELKQLLSASANISTPALKKTRRTNVQVLSHRAVKEDERLRNERSFLAAREMIMKQHLLPLQERRSQQEICDAVNRMNNTNMPLKTLQWRMYQQKKNNDNSTLQIGRGRRPALPTEVEDALVTALETYTNLTAVGMKQKPTRPEKIQRLSDCLKNGPCSLKDYTSLYGRLNARYAARVEVSTKRTAIDDRRTRWTTFNVINNWFDRMKTIFLQYGFARLPTAEEIAAGHEGELYFPPEQLRRIVNVDETALTLDGTSTATGGRPPTQYGPSDKQLPSGADRTNKSNWRCTFITGSNAAGEPIPGHFQLRSSAKEERNKRIHSAFANKLHHKSATSYGMWGIDGVTPENPVAVQPQANCNASGGMDSVEFKKYAESVVIDLYRDAQPAFSKWVCLVADSGPGRDDGEFRVVVTTNGFILVPGPPNTTHVTQVTDQNYGPFKSRYRENKQKLFKSRRERGMTVRPEDVPGLVYGFGADADDPKLRPAFHEAFASDVSRLYWRKVGIVPFTRNCLSDRNVAHEVMIGPDGSIDLDADPVTDKLLDLERRNQLAIQVLKKNGFNGSVFAAEAPRNHSARTTSSVNMELSQTELLDKLQQAHTVSKKYCVLGGRPYNCKEQAIVDERVRREIIIKALKEKKSRNAAYAKKKEAALLLIGKCSGEFAKLSVTELKKVFEWKLAKKSTGLKKGDLVKALVDARTAEENNPGEVDAPAMEWTESDEELLIKMETELVQFEDTQTAKEMVKKQEEAIHTVLAMTDERIALMERHSTAEAVANARKLQEMFPTRTSLD